MLPSAYLEDLERGHKTFSGKENLMFKHLCVTITAYHSQERGCECDYIILSAEVWKNRNETKNFSQRHELELIKEEKRKEIEVEIRKQVTDASLNVF